MADDRNLAHEIERQIGMAPGVDLRNVRVTVKDGRATLQGVVSTQAEKDAALAAVVHVGGVTSVDDALAIEDPGTAHSVHTQQEENQAAGSAR